MCKFKALSIVLLLQLLFILQQLNFSCAENMLTYIKQVNLTDIHLSNLADHLAEQYAIEYITFIKTGDESVKLQKLHKQLLMQRSNQSWAHGFKKVEIADKFLACTTCRTIVKAAEYILSDQKGEWIGIDKEIYARRFFLDVCERFDILKQDVCKGYFKAYWPIFEYFSQNEKIDKRLFCNRLGIKFCSIAQPTHNWVLTINDDNILKFKKPTMENTPLNGRGLKILQITDLHYDPEYKSGSLADCNEPLCCHDMPVNNEATTKLAGYWGDYRFCDAPLHTIENAFNQMRKTHQDIKYIYHTGDVIAHISWSTTKASMLEMFTHMDKLMTEKFPGIPVYPCIGNNDVYPSDISSPADVPQPLNNNWLYWHLYMLWAKHLPQDTMETILKGGYYTVSPHAGFRIISLNSNECRLNNFWLYFNGSFAIEQLQWLHDTLLMAEQRGEFVHILSHTPIGGADCWKPWLNEYFRLIERFQHIITGIFYGHTHTNDMTIHYDSHGKPITVAWHGGSVTSFFGRNPSYRIYEANTKNMQIVDHETWTFNLTAANLNGSSQFSDWFRLSRFSEDFTSDLSPTGIDVLLDHMATNPQLLRKYWLCKTAASDATLSQTCDLKCLQATLCGINNQEERCRFLKTKLLLNLPPETFAVRNSAALNITLQISVFLFILIIFCIFISI